MENIHLNSNLLPQHSNLDGQQENVKQRKREYNSLLHQAKEAEKGNNAELALQHYRNAHVLFQSDKLALKIKRLSDQLAKAGSHLGSDPSEVATFTPSIEPTNAEGELLLKPDTTTGQHYLIGETFRISCQIYERLFDYQRQGVEWLYGLHLKGAGGILGDDMGLGKTFQTIAFLHGLFATKAIRTALIVVPVSTMTAWENELREWIGRARLKIYSGSKATRESAVKSVVDKSGILLTSYGMIASNGGAFKMHPKNLEEIKWDYVILDEGHKIKNPSTITARNLRHITAAHRLLLTGTPIQNNLKELWALLDFACQSRLLGSAKRFSLEFENKITKGQERDATARDRQVAAQVTDALWSIIKPHILQRSKSDVFGPPSSRVELNEDVGNDLNDETTLKAQITKALQTEKRDIVLWCHLSSTQERLYNAFLQKVDVYAFVRGDDSPLAAISFMKRLCCHPALCHSEYLESSINTLIQDSGKLQLLLGLLDILISQGHRMLIFSQSKVMIDIIEKVVDSRSIRSLRIDGTVSKADERQARISAFNQDESVKCFLLTTGVGSVGITLTGADRVIIFDPSWNPANDYQAIDRAYRIGQTKDVIAYRFIACGTIEEKMYGKQVMKDGLIRTVRHNMNQSRYFKRDELKAMFTLGETRSSELCDSLTVRHQDHILANQEHLQSHISNILATNHCYGATYHDLLYVETNEEVDEPHPDVVDEVAQATSRLVLSRSQDSEDEEEDFSRRRQNSRPGRKIVPDEDSDDEMGNKREKDTPRRISKKKTTGARQITLSDSDEQEYDDSLYISLPTEGYADDFYDADMHNFHHTLSNENYLDPKQLQGKEGIDSMKVSTPLASRHVEQHSPDCVLAKGTPLSYPCHKCSCSLFPSEKAAYQHHISVAKAQESEGLRLEAIHSYLQAVKIRDDDAVVHEHISQLSKALSWA